MSNPGNNSVIIRLEHYGQLQNLSDSCQLVWHSLWHYMCTDYLACMENKILYCHLLVRVT